jgi:chromosome segregation ATPase
MLKADKKKKKDQTADCQPTKRHCAEDASDCPTPPPAANELMNSLMTFMVASAEKEKLLLAANTTIEDLRGQLTAANGAVAELKEQQAAEHSRIREEERDIRRTEREMARVQLQNLGGEMATLQQQMQEQLKASHLENKQLQDSQQAQAAEFAAAQAELQAARQQLHDQLGTIQRMQAELDSAQIASHTAEDRAQQHLLRLSAAQKSSQGKDDDIAALQEQIQQAAATRESALAAANQNFVRLLKTLHRNMASELAAAAIAALGPDAPATVWDTA